jgi:hypothetical protein
LTLLTPSYAAVAIAAAFAFLGLLTLAGGTLRRPLVWLCVLAGAGAGFFAREAVKLVVDLVSPVGALGTGAGGFAVNVVVAAAVGELLKALGPLTLITLAPTDARSGLAYGAAAGAGFGFIVVQQGVTLVLRLLGSPFITPVSMAAAIAGWFFRILPQVATTAYVARAGVRGGLGLALPAAIVLQAALGFTDRLPVLAGVPVGLVVTAVASVAFVLYLRGVRNAEEWG